MNWSLKNIDTETYFQIEQPFFTVGRKVGANLQTTSTLVSRDHAEFLVLGDGCFCVEDHGSSNGTFVNNIRIPARVRQTLRHNDIVGIGAPRNGNQANAGVLFLKVIYRGSDVIVIDDSPPASPPPPIIIEPPLPPHRAKIEPKKENNEAEVIEVNPQNEIQKAKEGDIRVERQENRIDDVQMNEDILNNQNSDQRIAHGCVKVDEVDEEDDVYVEEDPFDSINVDIKKEETDQEMAGDLMKLCGDAPKVFNNFISIKKEPSIADPDLLNKVKLEVPMEIDIQQTKVPEIKCKKKTVNVEINDKPCTDSFSKGRKKCPMDLVNIVGNERELETASIDKQHGENEIQASNAEKNSVSSFISSNREHEENDIITAIYTEENSRIPTTSLTRKHKDGFNELESRENNIRLNKNVASGKVSNLLDIENGAVAIEKPIENIIIERASNLDATHPEAGSSHDVNIEAKADPDVVIKNEPANYSVIDDYVVITDDEDDELFACSQLKMNVKKETDEVIKNFEELQYKDELMRSSPPLIELDDFYEDDEDLLNQLLTQKEIVVQDEASKEIVPPQSSKEEDFEELAKFFECETTDDSRQMAKDRTTGDLRESLQATADVAEDLGVRVEVNCGSTNKQSFPRESKYMKPPIIEPHQMHLRTNKKVGDKRKSTHCSTESAKKCKVDTVAEFIVPAAPPRKFSRKPKPDSHSKSKNQKGKSDLDAKDKSKIKATRAERLKELSSKSRPTDKFKHQIKPSAEVRVKTSNGRGGFLIADAPPVKQIVPREGKRPKKLSFKHIEQPTARVHKPSDVPKTAPDGAPSKGDSKKMARDDRPRKDNSLCGRSNNLKDTKSSSGESSSHRNMSSSSNVCKTTAIIENETNNSSVKRRVNIPDNTENGSIDNNKYRSPVVAMPVVKLTKCDYELNVTKNNKSNCNQNNGNKCHNITSIASNYVNNADPRNLSVIKLDMKNCAEGNRRSLDSPTNNQATANGELLNLNPDRIDEAPIALVGGRPRVSVDSPFSSPEYAAVAASYNPDVDLKFLSDLVANSVNTSTIIKKIVQWCPKWLPEQRHRQASPPVTSHDSFVDVPDKFACYSDYLKVYSPLLLLEIWRSVFSEWVKTERICFEADVLHQRVVRDLSYVDCQVTDRSRNLTIKNSYLMLAEMPFKSGDEVKVKLQKRFGYITESNFKKRTDPVTGEELHIFSFSMATKLDGNELKHNKILCRMVTNLTGYVNFIKNFKALEKSTLMHRLIQPTLDSFFMPFEDLGNLENIGNSNKLNSVQATIVKEAVQVCIQKDPGIYLIQGPPGTGKSTVIVSIILQILYGHPEHKPRILLTAPSNTAVDGLVMRLSVIRQSLPDHLRKRIKMIRIGPDKSLSEGVKGFTPRYLAKKELWASLFESSPHLIRLYEALEHNIRKLTAQRQQLIDSEQDPTVIDQQLCRLKTQVVKETFMKKYMKTYEYDMVNKIKLIIRNCNIVCTTINSCVNWSIHEVINSSTAERPFYFTCCIMDEATQCHEIEALTPLQLGIEKFVLVGDPQQLSATILSSEAKKCNLGKSLFTRISNNFSDGEKVPFRTLNVQYRMHEEIVRFPNSRFYKNILQTEHNVKNKIVPAIAPYLVFNLDKNVKVLQYHNLDEISFVKRLIEVITSTISTSCQYSIGVITPYNAQKEAIKNALPTSLYKTHNITVNTVDSFQGQEKDIIIISYVRKMPNLFLNDIQRINVALTRARQALFVVGTYDLFKHSNILYDVREDAKRRRLCRDISNIDEYFTYMRKDIFGIA